MLPFYSISVRLFNNILEYLLEIMTMVLVTAGDIVVGFHRSWCFQYLLIFFTIFHTTFPWNVQIIFVSAFCSIFSYTHQDQKLWQVVRRWYLGWATLIQTKVAEYLSNFSYFCAGFTWYLSLLFTIRWCRWHICIDLSIVSAKFISTCLFFSWIFVTLFTSYFAASFTSYLFELVT